MTSKATPAPRSPLLSVPCFRCGAPIGCGVEGPGGLIALLASGAAVASKAYYMHADDSCGGYLQPGAGQDRAVYAPFRKAVGVAMSAALDAAGYVHMFAIPAPVQLGSADYAPLKAASDAAYTKSRQTPVKVERSVMAPDCLFTMTGAGTWVNRATLAEVNATTPTGGAPTPTAAVAPPAPMAPPVMPPAPMAMPPAPMAMPVPPVYVTLSTGAVATMAHDAARVGLASGTVRGVYVGGAWVTSL